MCMCSALKRVSGVVSAKQDPDQGKALPLLQTGTTWAFVPTDL